MYWKTVTSCAAQSLQNCVAENLRASTIVAPESSAAPAAITPPAEW